MDEVDPQYVLSFVGKTDGEIIERHDLKNVRSGDVLRAITGTSVWLIEVSGLNTDGCVEGLLTHVSEVPLRDLGILPLPNVHILRAPAKIGGFLSSDSERFSIDARLPDRSPKTAIETAPITSITRFRFDND